MVRNFISMIWRRIPERYNLVGNHCEACGKDYFPQRKVCPHCRRKGKLVAKAMPREGKIYSFTQVHSAPTGFEHESPYYLAIIELSNGVKLLTQLVDSPKEKVKNGAKAKMVFRKIFQDDEEGAIAYGYKFKVA